MARIGEDRAQDRWDHGVGGLEGPRIKKSGRLAEEAVDSDSCQKMGAVRVDCPSCGR